MIKAQAQAPHFCGQSSYEKSIVLTSEEQQAIDQLEENYRYHIKYTSNAKKASSQLVIPVAFHVIHNNGSENISDYDLIKALDRLNKAFANLDEYSDSDGTDTQISFCLAKRDELGNGFSGITRHESIYTDMSIFSGYDFVRSKIFDPKQYLNIQVVKNVCLGTNCDVAGFAGSERVVIDADLLGDSRSNTSLLVHEIGHYFGLLHTWHDGCENTDCLKDGDRVCDTPPDNRTFEHCFASTNSCNSDEQDLSLNNPFRPIPLGGLGDQIDHHTNYMDYNWLECLNVFTFGQAARMRFFIEERHESLITSRVCLEPCTNPSIADFDSPDSIAIGSSLTINNQSSNAQVYQWYVDGVAYSMAENLTYNFNDIGIIEIGLESSTIDSLCLPDFKTKKILVFCPVQACFQYDINDQYLNFENCSLDFDSLKWTILDDDNNLIYCSNSISDRFYVNNIEFLQLCIEASTQLCSKEYCEYITITNDGSEVCSNEEDDDGDGLIDIFDPDCPCDNEAYQAQCPTDCEIIPDSFPNIKMKMKWESQVLSDNAFLPSTYCIGDFYNSGDINIVGFYGKGERDNVKNYTAILNGGNGELLDTFRIFKEHNSNQIAIRPSIVRDKASNKSKILVKLDYIACIDQDGTEEFRSSAISQSVLSGVVDIDHDGDFEIYSGSMIFNGQNGNLLYDGYIDPCENGYCLTVSSICADVIGNDGRPELITGKYVYDLNLVNKNDASGNTAAVIEAPTGIEDGKCAVADIDGDGLLEIIVLRNNFLPNFGATQIVGNLSIWDPRTRQLLSQVTNPVAAESFIDGGIPFVGDVDGDCLPEIGVVFTERLQMYKYNLGAGILEEFYHITTTDDSGITSVTMFDFNQDGKQELIYRDETSLKIIEGATGFTIDSVLLLSRTNLEYPIIADVDNDGQAEIIISGSETDEDKRQIFCFESASAPWAPARSVWNQYAYNPTQVNDDLTIPRYPQNPAQALQGTENCPRETCNTPYNNFMVQATYRTQEGCYIWPSQEKDLSITGDIKCIGDSLEICVYTEGATEEDFMQGIYLACYFLPLQNNPILSETITQDSTCFIIANTLIFDSIALVINDQGTIYPPSLPNTGIDECDYTNNEYILTIESPDFSINIVDTECTTDSLIFYIATDNVDLDTELDCIAGGCFFSSPSDQVSGIDPQQGLLELTSWCFDYDSTTMSYQYLDTFRVAIPHPVGISDMWWTINEGGFGPGLSSAAITGIYECNYENNIDSISFDLSTSTLDLGPDITKCGSEIFTLHAGSGFSSYLWNDLSTDSIYSEIAEGLHYVEATDFCGRVYRDTVVVTFDHSDQVDLGPDRILCAEEELTININDSYDNIDWYPASVVDCASCAEINLRSDTSLMLIVRATTGACVSLDSIWIERLVPMLDSTSVILCPSETYLFFGDTLSNPGRYEHLSDDCTSLSMLDLEYLDADTTTLQAQLCAGDSVRFGADYLRSEGTYQDILSNQYACDSLLILDLTIVDLIHQIDTLNICEGDSIFFFDAWQDTPGLYEQLYSTISGCDSLKSYQLFVDPLAYSVESIALCPGDSTFVLNQWFYESNLLSFTRENTMGCDTFVDLVISLSESYEVYDTLQLCKGDTITVFGFMVTGEMDLLETDMASNGCDSTLYVHVEEVDFLRSEESAIICPGDSILIDAIWYTASDTLSNVHSSTSGCDSIHTLFVELLPEIDLPTLEINCEDQSVLASVAVGDDWQILWDNGDTTSTTSYSSGTTAMVSLFHESTCIEDFIIELPKLADTSSLPSYQDTTIQFGESFVIDIVLDSNEWSWTISPEDITDCKACSTAVITPLEDSEVMILFNHISGCSFRQSFVVNIAFSEDQNSIYIPNAFSPNGDAYNDNWLIYNAEENQILSCTIYDRWGNKVYEVNNQTINWDGNFKGQALNPGVYIYTINYINVDGEKISHAGDLTLMR